MKNKTSIIVSHRVSSVKIADKIVLIENGTAVEQGSHDELINLKGLYYELYQKQIAGE